MESHCCSRLEIAELVATSGCVAVRVEEFGNGCLVLREVSVLLTLVPFLVEVEHVVCLWCE